MIIIVYNLYSLFTITYYKNNKKTTVVAFPMEIAIGDGPVELPSENEIQMFIEHKLIKSTCTVYFSGFVNNIPYESLIHRFFSLRIPLLEQR